MRRGPALRAQSCARRWAPSLLCALLSALAQGVPAGGVEARRPLQVDDLFRLREVGDPQLSPDGVWLAYTVTRLDAGEDRSRTGIWMVPTAGGEAVPLTDGRRTAWQPRWSPDGRYLAFLAASSAGEDAQLWTLFRHGGEAVQRTSVVQGVSAFEWSPEGSRFALVIADPTPAQAARAAAGADAPAAREQAPPPHVVTRRQFKRDYVGYLDDRRTHLYVQALAGEAPVQVTRGNYDDSEPAWSPDGRWLAFTSNRTADPDANEDSDIWRVAVDGAQEPVRVSRSQGPDAQAAWSPDGRWIAYVSATDTRALVYATPHLAVVAADGGEARVLTQALDRAVSAPRFAPDGRDIYCLVEDERERYLARVAVRDGRVDRVIHGARSTSAYDLGAGPAVAALVSEPQRPAELYLLEHGRLTQRTHENDALLAQLALGTVLPVDYPSADGTRVQGFLLTPPGYQAAQRHPALLSLHGGPVSQYDYGFDFESQLLAAAGYLMILPNPRGSSGRGQEYAHAIWQGWGQKDYEDVMAAVDHAIATGYADPARLGVGGWSYGGLLTNHVITRTDRFKAAISGAGSTLYVSNYGHDEYQYWWENELGLPWRNRPLWEALSPFNRVERVVTPTLLVGGEEDWNVPIINGEQMYMALRRLGVPTQLVVYPGEHHLIGRPSYLKDLYERYLDWYGTFLGRGASVP